MSQLSIQLTVISHNKDAIERVLNYPCEFTTIRELFFHELTQIVAYDEAPWIHSITSQSAVALDRTYYTTIQQILTALDGHGIVYANGFDDGSAETGSLLCGWNEIIYEGCKYDAQKLASDSNCKCKAGRIHSYKDEQLIDYYVRTLPESEKQSYEDSMESIRQNMLHDFELKLSKYQNELAKVTVEADQTIQLSKKKFWSYLLQHSATYDELKKKLQVCGGKFAFSLFNADYYVITPYKAGASMDNLTDVAHALVEIDKAISEILSVIKTRKRYPALKIISLEMLEKPLIDVEIPATPRIVEFEDKKNRILKASVYDHKLYMHTTPSGIDKARASTNEPEDVDSTRNTCNFKSKTTRNRYFTSLSECTCPFYQNEVIVCKHMIRLAVWLGYPVGEDLDLAPGETIEAAVERKKAEIYDQKVRKAAEKESRRLEAEAARQQKKAEDERKRIALKEAAAAARRESAEAAERQRVEREAEKQRQKDAEENARLERIQQEAIERERKIQLNVLYRPGEEPANIRKRIDTLFPKLDAAYPDKRISGLNKEHKKWGETVTELYRALGYPDGRAFLEAYGYTVVENKGGRSSTNDYAETITELQRRYPNGAGKITVDELKLANSDLPIKSLQNSAKELFGMPLGKYLKEIGIISNE